MVKTVLLADDSDFMRHWLTRILTASDFNVIGEARNGKEAIERFYDLKPDLVIMDLIMPELDGIAALRHIMASDPAATVVVCSSMGQKALIMESLKTGAKDFIVKPNFNGMVSLLKKLLY